MEWWVSMPKVELHAHLNGSIRDSTLLELTKALGEKDNRSVKEVFQLFDLIRILTTDHAIVTRITREVIEDFASENVVYLELRTTPKRNEAIGMTKGSYIEAVLEGLRSVTSVDVNFIPHHKEDSRTLFSPNNGSSRKRIYVRLLLSIDRRETTEAAMETVKLALERSSLESSESTSPEIHLNTYLPALKFARNQGLYVSLHCGEIPNPKEIHQMLDFKPERIGHAICFEKEHWEILKSSKIPVEICLTSNIRTLTVRSIHVHHFGLGKRELFELSRNAVELIFAERQVQEDLTKYFDSVAKTMGVYKNKIHSYEL
ncbi:hypothetical protein Ahy_B04g069418 isoform A [Arachis hypogaea]|uniref:Adenosine deaminase domain-containing protein n=1 Tax=Arachis hypogaea TaxID=3818 RepID=A0A444ZCL2_ARAHY|nr:hypothetical protein Ahy_B04g069418 isoform A [Arachis hypogaea]